MEEGRKVINKENGGRNGEREKKLEMKKMEGGRDKMIKGETLTIFKLH